MQQEYLQIGEIVRPQGIRGEVKLRAMRRPVAARPARSYPGELGGHQGREEQPMVHLPYGGGRQSPGQPGAVLESWVATKGGRLIKPIEPISS